MPHMQLPHDVLPVSGDDVSALLSWLEQLEQLEQHVLPGQLDEFTRPLRSLQQCKQHGGVQTMLLVGCVKGKLPPVLLLADQLLGVDTGAHQRTLGSCVQL